MADLEECFIQWFDIVNLPVVLPVGSSVLEVDSWVCLLVAVQLERFGSELTNDRCH